MEEKGLSDRAKKDLELVNAALAGDQRAYTELMTDYRDNVFYMMNRMVNNRDDAEDLTIEAFGKAFKRLDQYRSDFAFSTWLFKIASNNCIDFLRRKKKAKLISLDEGFANEDGEERKMEFESEALNPEEKFMKAQRSDELHRIVDLLKPKYRNLVEMRYFQEMSYEEIADELELPLGTVKAQLFRARELMFEILKNSKSNI